MPDSCAMTLVDVLSEGLAPESSTGLPRSTPEAVAVAREVALRELAARLPLDGPARWSRSAPSPTTSMLLPHLPAWYKRELAKLPRDVTASLTH